GRYPRRTVELADPTLSEANYDDANIADRDPARRSPQAALDQAWQDRKAELALEQAEDRKFILGVAAASRTGGAGEKQESPLGSLPDAEEGEKSAARKQIEEREAARKSGFKPQVQQGDSFEPQAWSPVASRRRQ
ncbi:hypothetical protein BGZ92_003272, partial [Podila epicladia]